MRGALWTAPAERSGDGAFARTTRLRTIQVLGPLESGVALRLPPQSKIAYSPAMPVCTIPWPHAPEHRLSVRGTYFVTASTYLRQHHFSGKARLAVLPRVTLNPPQTGDILDCADRAQRRRRFRTHYMPADHPTPSPARKRCRASLATAVHDAGASHHGSRTCEASRCTIWRH